MKDSKIWPHRHGHERLPGFPTSSATVVSYGTSGDVGEQSSGLRADLGISDSTVSGTGESIRKRRHKPSPEDPLAARDTLCSFSRDA